jgi:hypothetical protein
MLVVAVLRRIVYTLLSFYRSVSLSSEFLPWKELLRCVELALLTATDSLLTGLRKASYGARRIAGPKVATQKADADIETDPPALLALQKRQAAQRRLQSIALPRPLARFRFRTPAQTHFRTGCSPAQASSTDQSWP